MKLCKYFNIYLWRNLLLGLRSLCRGNDLLASPCQSVSQSVCLSVPMFVRVSVAAIGRIFLWILKQGKLKKICWENPSLIKIGQNIGHFTSRHRFLKKGEKTQIVARIFRHLSHKSWQAPTNFVMGVCPSPIGLIFVKFGIRDSTEFCQEIPNLLKVERKCLPLYVRIKTFVLLFVAM